MKQIWSNFKEKHPELAKWLYQIFYFIVFSEGVTIFQYLIFTFMPKMQMVLRGAIHQILFLLKK